MFCTLPFTTKDFAKNQCFDKLIPIKLKDFFLRPYLLLLNGWNYQLI